ncbi:MAG: M23 family metallopeptidase [Thermodesulfobacteriota bacterium]
MSELVFIKPVDSVMLDKYGARGGKHYGIDFKSGKDKPVKASERGRVVRTADNDGGYGKVIIIDHTPKAKKSERHTYTLYAHLDEYLVAYGDTVDKGQTIAESGNTGRVFSNSDGDGSHLHFEVIDAPEEMEWDNTGAIGFHNYMNREDPECYFGLPYKLNGTLGDLSDKEAEYLINERISYRLLDISRMAVLVDGVIKDIIDEANKSVTVILEYDEKELEKLMTGPMPPPKKHAPLDVNISIKL